MAAQSILIQLALYHIEVYVCPHFTPPAVYRRLVEEILPNEVGHVELQRTQWVSCFHTGESCPACEAQSDREHEEYEKKKPPRDSRGPDLPATEIPF